MTKRNDRFAEGEQKNLFVSMAVAMAVAAVMTVLLLLLLTVLLYNTGISKTVSGILMVAIYVLGPFAGAFVLGKMVKKKRFLWGLALGVVYFAVFVVISMLCAKSGTQEVMVPGVRDYVEVLLAVLPGGVLGGMFS